MKSPLRKVRKVKLRGRQMPKKKAGKVRAKTAEARVLAELSEAEEDLVWHMEQGYQLETDSLGGNPVLRNLKNNEALRPASANRSTVKALAERGLIVPGKGRDPLKIVWRLTNRPKK
jgi:hypothetical protein